MSRTNTQGPRTRDLVPQAKRGPGRPSKVEDVARRLSRVIDDVLRKPGERVSQAEMLRRAGVPKSTLDELKDHELVKPLKALMLGIAQARGSADATVDSGVHAARQAAESESEGVAQHDVPSEVLDLVRITGVYSEKMRTAVGAMGRFMGRHVRAKHVSALPMTVRELEMAVRQLQGVLLALKPLNEQWLAGPGKAPGAGQDERGALQLDLRIPSDPQGP